MVSTRKRALASGASSARAISEKSRSTKRKRTTDVASQILEAEKSMSDELSKLSFAHPVTHVYNPLEYAWEAHEWYVQRYGSSTKKVLLVGMNPGPWGMAQTGVPFGEVTAVRDFLKMPDGTRIRRPLHENAKRPVSGLSCARSEVSGKRLWREWAQTEYGDAETFFKTFFVHNYCPLMFMESGGRNRTPVQLKAAERNAILETCDIALKKVVEVLEVQAVCGVGGFAEKRCRVALDGTGVAVHSVLHPSPASPAANRGWATQAKKQIDEVLQVLEVDPSHRDK
ncbi:single-stranded DNA-binding protein [Gracilaria domingensis]|nr:single-stranded DNA-binding protein [Gracilaria domingensis]